MHWFEGINRNNTYEHEKAKVLQALKLVYYEGCKVALEPILQNGHRPDVLVVDTPRAMAYEIMQSEKEESIIRKNTTYGDIHVVPVRLQSQEKSEANNSMSIDNRQLSP